MTAEETRPWETTVKDLKDALNEIADKYDKCKVQIWNKDKTVYSPRFYGMATKSGKRFLDENEEGEIFVITGFL